PTPAPATVARGGLLLVNGTNLGPIKLTAATTTPLPTKLGTPEVEVTLNGTALPLLSVSANKIIAQVPYDAPIGTVTIKVNVGGVSGPAAGVVIAATQPSIRTRNGIGTGIYAGASNGDSIILAVSGLGVTRPALVAGDLPTRATVPNAGMV